MKSCPLAKKKKKVKFFQASVLKPFLACTLAIKVNPILCRSWIAVELGQNVRGMLSLPWFNEITLFSWPIWRVSPSPIRDRRQWMGGRGETECGIFPLQSQEGHISVARISYRQNLSEDRNKFLRFPPLNSFIFSMQRDGVGIFPFGGLWVFEVAS